VATLAVGPPPWPWVGRPANRAPRCLPVSVRCGEDVVIPFREGQRAAFVILVPLVGADVVLEGVAGVFRYRVVGIGEVQLQEAVDGLPGMELEVRDGER